MAQPGNEDQVFPARQHLVHGGKLSREADGFPDAVRGGHHVEAIDGGSAGVGRQQRGKDPHHSGFAGAVGSEKGEDGSCGHLKVHPAQHLDLFKGLPQAPHRNDGGTQPGGFHGGPPSFRCPMGRQGR